MRESLENPVEATHTPPPLPELPVSYDDIRAQVLQLPRVRANELVDRLQADLQNAEEALESLGVSQGDLSENECLLGEALSDMFK